MLKNCRMNKTTLHLIRPGKPMLRILCGDADTVLQKVVLDCEGLKRSYQGSPPGGVTPSDTKSAV